MATIISTNFPEEDVRKLRLLCALQGVSIQATINEAMQDFIKKHEHKIKGVVEKEMMAEAKKVADDKKKEGGH